MDNMEKCNKEKKKPFPLPFPPSVTIRDCSRKWGFAVLCEQKCVVFKGGWWWFFCIIFLVKLRSVALRSALQQSGSNQPKAWKRHYVTAERQKKIPFLVLEALWQKPVSDLSLLRISGERRVPLAPREKRASARFQQTIPAFPSPPLVCGCFGGSRVRGQGFIS